MSANSKVQQQCAVSWADHSRLKEKFNYLMCYVSAIFDERYLNTLEKKIGGHLSNTPTNAHI